MNEKIDSNKSKVLEFINMHFDSSQIFLSAYPMLPGGTLLEDKCGGKMLIWYDFDKEKVCYDAK